MEYQYFTAKRAERTDIRIENKLNNWIYLRFVGDLNAQTDTHSRIKFAET